MLSFLVDNLCFLGGDPIVRLAADDVPPIAVDDPLTVLRGSGPVNVAVMANDVDPEGQPLTLVSAFAALGTAVAEPDGTVTYTPPQGEPAATVDFDTVVYEIEDVEGARDTGQIDITISDPELAITVSSDNTLEVTAANEPVEITVTEPDVFAGTYTFDAATLFSGPVGLVAPRVSGVFAVGEQVVAEPGLWAVSTEAGTPVKGYQWLRGGTAIAGATNPAYTLVAADLPGGISVVETVTNTFGAQSAQSAVYVGQAGFVPADDPELLGWFDAADAATITEVSGAVSQWADKAGGEALVQPSSGARPQTGMRTQNGLNSLDFQGNVFLSRAEVLPSDGDVAFHGVFVIDAVTNPFEALLAVNATVDFQVDANNTTQFDGRLNPAGTGTPVNFTGGPFSGAFVMSVIFDRTGAGSAEVYISDVLRGQTGYTTPLDVATDLYVMTNRSQNAFVDGAVCELAVTRSTANRAEYHAYLAAKWGVA